YVESKVQASRRLDPGSTDGVGRYYADSVEGPGWWFGGGSDALGLDGRVTPAHLERVLIGEHPGTGETLRRLATPIREQQNAGAATRYGDVLTLTEAAEIAGMSAPPLPH